VTKLGLDDQNSIRFLAEARIISCHRIQAGPTVHTPSYPMGTRALSLGTKRPEREADHRIRHNNVLQSSAQGQLCLTFITTDFL